MSNVYGPHIKAIRMKKGIKAAYVAKRIAVSPPTYSQIESGLRGLSAERLRGIVRALEISAVDLDEVVYGAGKQQTRKTKIIVKGARGNAM